MNPDHSTNTSQKKIDKIVEVLKGDGLVILPTDTVYGIFTKAFSDTTFKRMEAIKQARNTPYSVTFNNTRALFDWYGPVDLIRRHIIGDLTPGPVTIVLQYNDRVPENYRYASHGVGLRVGSNLVLNQVMAKLDFPLWSTSANKSGDSAPVRYSEVGSAVLKQVDSSIDDGETDYLKSSDVIDLRNRPFSSLRVGPWHEKIGTILAKSEEPFYIVVVCTGNLCRSPLAEALIRIKTDTLPNANVIVESAGVYAVDGYPATEEMVNQGKRLSVDLSAHRAQQLTPAIIQRAGLMLTATAQHRNMILSNHPQALHKVRLLGEFLGDNDISDPYQMGEAAYISSANHIASAVYSWSNEFATSFSDTEHA